MTGRYAYTLSVRTGSVVSRYETDIRLTDIYAGESAQCRLTLTDDDRRRLVEMPAESKNAGKSEVALAVGIENPTQGCRR